MTHISLAMVEIRLGVLVLLGLGVLGGALGAWFFQKIKVPQVVGYIAFGLLIGKSGFGLLRTEDIENFGSFTWFALGIIGFLVGGELKIDTFRQYGKQFIQILLWEGISAFLIVSACTFGVVFWLSGSVPISLAAGVVLGAIASATDPASTIDVLWEYRARGVLTTTIIAIVALDDALAMTLYGIGTSCAEMFLGQGNRILHHLLKVLYELGGSVLFGLLCGGLMVLLLRYVYQKKERMLAIGIGMLLLIIGVCGAVNLDVILVTMSMGMLLINRTPHRSEKLFELVRSFSGPIYVMFFVLVGARLGIGSMPWWAWTLVALYVAGRSTGKIFGCYMGARLSGATETVRKYSGTGILAQGGVAIGLSIMASHHLGDIQITDNISLGEMIVSIVTATTFIVQIIGPTMTKFSIRWAGENDRNITKEDMMEKLTVAQAAIRGIEPLHLTDQIASVVQRFSLGDRLVYPIVDADGKMAGTITLSQLKDILLDSDCWEWMVVQDILVPGSKVIGETASLKKAMVVLEETGAEQLVVLDADKVPTGMLDARQIRKAVERERLNLLAVG
ncbi:MAG: cation:proton antiporter [Planctomycetes bacterium]|nr:cation:proton antiporter [Planctomycetota bacterium]